MEAREQTRFDERGLVVGSRRVPFYAGAMHYWRVPPARWAACLKQMHAIGFTCVETYVPWRVQCLQARGPARGLDAPVVHRGRVERDRAVPDR